MADAAFDTLNTEMQTWFDEKKSLVIALQNAYMAASPGGQPAQLRRTPFLPPSAGTAVTIPDDELDFSLSPAIPDTTSSVWTTPPTVDPVTKLVTDPGTPAFGWEVAPVQHASGRYYVEGGRPNPAPPLAPGPTARLMMTDAGETIPEDARFSVSISVHKRAGEWGWTFEVMAVNSDRTQYSTISYGEGPGSKTSDLTVFDVDAEV